MLKVIEAQQRSERQAQMIEDATELAMDQSDGSNLIGYVTLAFYTDGGARSAGYRPSPQDHKIGEAMFRAWAKQVLDDHISYGEGVSAAHNVLNGDA
jgi:hypothetical protein